MLSLAALSVLLASASGCGPAEADLAGSDPQSPAAQAITVAVAPMVAAIAPSTAYTFAATVTGSADTAVTWSVEEATGGTIDSAGVYTAPGSAGGPYHVVAKSVADPTKLQRATVTVTSTAITPPPPPPPPATSGAVVAFPGAEGGGANSVGGRGGKVYVVNTLGSGSGCAPGGVGTCSLSDCLGATNYGSLLAAADGTADQRPRVCVFTVSGNIPMKQVVISYPYLTIAGQTSPAGVQLTAPFYSDGSAIWVGTHDVVIRYMRFRGSYGSAIAVQGTGRDIHNVVLDHVSAEYCGNDCISVAGGPTSDPTPPRGVTLSWSILAESVAATTNRTAVILDADDAGNRSRMVDVDLHHNYLATHNHRLPKIGIARARVVNNLVYNTDTRWVNLQPGAGADLVGNIYKRGPGRNTVEHPVHICSPSGQSVFVANNTDDRYMPSAGSGDQAEWDTLARAVSGENGEDAGSSTPAPTTYRRSTPAPRTYGVAITATTLVGDGSNLTSALLASDGVGASQRIDCSGRWVSSRDTLDARIVGYFYAPSGAPGYHTPTASDLGTGPYTIPTLSGGSACTDSDGDGMPDAWETARGLDPSNPADGRAVSANGYTNLENYLNGQ